MLDGSIGEFQLNIGRFLCMVVILFPILVWQKPSMRIRRKYLLPLLGLSLSYFGLNIVAYASTTYVPAATATTIACGSYLVITLMSLPLIAFYGGNKVNKRTMLCDTLSVVILFISLLFVIQPDILFGVKLRQSYISYCNPFRFRNFTLNQKLTGNFSIAQNESVVSDVIAANSTSLSYIGYLYAIFTGIINFVRLVLGKYILKDENVTVVAMWIASGNTLLSILCTVAFETFEFPSSSLCIATLFCHSLFTACMTLFVLLATDDIPTVEASLIHSFAIPILFILQFTVLKEASPSGTTLNVMAVLGAIVVSLAVVMKPLCRCIIIYKLEKRLK